MSYPDRIDFQVLADRRVVVVKMRKNGARDIPTKHEVKTPDFDLDAALTWCKENGYTVRRWPGGARAWCGEPWPIRTGYQIVQLRRQLEADWLAEFRRNPGKWSTFDTLLTLDLAYDG